MSKIKKGVGVIALLGAMYGAPEVGLMPIIVPVQAQEERTDSESELERIINKIKRPVQETLEEHPRIRQLSDWKSYVKKKRLYNERLPTPEDFNADRRVLIKFLRQYRDFLREVTVPAFRKGMLQDNIPAKQRKTAYLLLYTDSNDLDLPYIDSARIFAHLYSQNQDSSSLFYAFNMNNANQVNINQVRLFEREISIPKRTIPTIPSIIKYERNRQGIMQLAGVFKFGDEAPGENPRRIPYTSQRNLDRLQEAYKKFKDKDFIARRP